MAYSAIGYLHVALMQGLGGLMVAAEMHGRLLSSGLYDATDIINVVLLGDQQQIKIIDDYIFSRYLKYKVRFTSNQLDLWEWPTLKLIYNDSKTSSDYIWYMHTKGASNCRPDVPNWIQHNLRSWRGVMSYYTINQYKNCIRLLGCGYDAVGPFFVKDPPYFAGNFWWSKSLHIRTLNKPIGTRNEAEGWIGTNKQANFFSLCDFPISGIDLYDFDCVYGDDGVFKCMPGSV